MASLDRLLELEYDDQERDHVEILAEFINSNLDEHEQLELLRHQERIAEGKAQRLRSGRWFDPEYEAAISLCRVHRNVATWARATRNRWLLGQIAVVYSGHPMWNDEWVDGMTDKYADLNEA